MKIIWIISLFFLLVSCWNTSIQSQTNEEIKPQEKEYKILALWDSLTAWYWLDYEDSYPFVLWNKLKENWYNYEVINAWVSWDTSKNLLSRINLYTEKYDVILLNIWWNDWLRSLNSDDLKENIISIINFFPDSEIVLFSIDLPFNYSSSYRNEIKKVYEDINNELDVNFYWLFFEWLDYNTHFLSDQIHPNKKWYEIISENIFKYLLKNNIIQND